MPLLQNPLRSKKPARAEVVHRGTYRVADERARYTPSVYKLRLSSDRLWLGPELSIPLELIHSLDILSEGRLPPRHALRVVYDNPIDGCREAVYVCKPIVVFYTRKPLVELKEQIEAQIQALPQRPAGPEFREESVVGEDGELACEVCGSQPAHYVGYRHLMGVLLISYYSEERRRVHCSYHNFLAGMGSYLVTAATGWMGISIVAWPFALWRCAGNLRPALGGAAYMLAGGPLVVLGVVLWRVITQQTG